MTGGSPRCQAADVLAVDGLTKTYRSRTRGEVHALEGVTFSVGAGEILGLLGPNGAGKTTAIKSILGLVRADAGSVVVDGVDAIASRRAALERMTAVLEGNRTVYWRLNVRENLEFFGALRGMRPREVRADIASLVSRFHLDDKAETPAMKLSRGMQQKLALACAVLPKTPLLLLDEPTLGLDVGTSHELRAYLRSLADDDGRAILLSSHDMHVVKDVCDRVVVINGGRVVADDTIERLLSLFRARAFRVVLTADVNDAVHHALVDRFEIVRRDGPNTLEVALRDSADLYDLIDQLRTAGLTIETINSVEPDLEEIFLKIVKTGPRS